MVSLPAGRSGSLDPPILRLPHRVLHLLNDVGEFHSGQTFRVRGLGNGRYQVEAYVAGQSLGVVTGPTARVQTRFTGHLLLMARPEAK